jgi:hypothetical protein
MSRTHDKQSHPAPHRGRVETYEAVFSVCAAPLAWIAQLSAIYAFTSSPCFAFGERQPAFAGVQPWPLVTGTVGLLVALAALRLAFVLYRRTEDEKEGGKRHLFETGTGRTRFLAVWGIAFSGVFSLLIAINIAMLLGLPVCAG